MVRIGEFEIPDLAEVYDTEYGANPTTITASTSRRPLNESADGDRFEGLQPTEARQQSATPARPAAPEVGVQEQSLRYL